MLLNFNFTIRNTFTAGIKLHPRIIIVWLIINVTKYIWTCLFHDYFLTVIVKFKRQFSEYIDSKLMSNFWYLWWVTNKFVNHQKNLFLYRPNQRASNMLLRSKNPRGSYQDDMALVLKINSKASKICAIRWTAIASNQNSWANIHTQCREESARELDHFIGGIIDVDNDVA